MGPVDGGAVDWGPAEFLVREAELLDNNQLREWLVECVAEDIVYEVPLRVTRERAADREFSEQAWYMKEDRASLEVRVERLYTSFVWAEDPPSRTRRFVTNVRVAAALVPGEVDVKSNLLMFHGRYDTADRFVVGERHDVLRSIGGSWRLARRRVLLDHTTLDISALSVFL
jgi:3-phenylpropionate/cinnamic acid dioxygenase small subunit